MARELARTDGLSKGTARNCRRVNAHKVTCEAVTQGFDSSLGAVATCTRKATARYRPHKRGKRRQSRTVLVAVNSAYECRFDYGQGGGGGTGGGGGLPAAPPAPDTVITRGPEEGSNVDASGSGSDAFAVVDFELAAIGGEDPIFECSIDGEPFIACFQTPLLGFHGIGPHTFRARAVSLRLGAVAVPDPTPAQRTFNLVTPAGQP